MNRVVVTGIGIIAPNGCGKSEFFNALKTGKSGITFIPELKKLNFGCHVGGRYDLSASGFYTFIEKYNLHDASDTIKLSVIAGIEAWNDSGLAIPEYNKGEADVDTGIIIGSGIGPVDIFGKRLIPFTDKGEIRRLRSTIVEHSMLSGPGSCLAGILASGNQVSFNSSACSTGVEAIIMGCERIRAGKAKRMIAGSVEVYSPYVWSGFDSMHVLTRKFNDKPEEASRPMSASASGFVPGAGAGILILEDYYTAVNRNAKIYCEISGEYLNSGGQRNGGSMFAPNPSGVVKCITGAINLCNPKPKNIELISGHLSSTMADPIEISNWITALKLTGTEFSYINALKSLTGHCIGASGSIETIAAILQMEHKFIHKSANCSDIHPEIEKQIPSDKIPFENVNNINIDYIAKASFGFGDVNSCIILNNITR